MKHSLLLLPLLQALRANAGPVPGLGGDGLPTIPDLLDDILPGLLDPGDGSDSDPGSGEGSGPVPGTGSGSGYTLTWADEFDSPQSNANVNSLPAATNWRLLTGTSYPSGAPNWGNNELQSYTTDTSNIHITSSSTLKITPRLSGSNPVEGPWTSGRMETLRTDFAASPGGRLYIESRLRTGCAPASQQAGIWPAFWALGASFRNDPTHWPMASEWDFVEVINGQPTVYNTLHCGTDSNEGGPCNEYTGLGNGGVSWSGCEWHTVGFEVDRSGSSGFSLADTASGSGSGGDFPFPGSGEGGWEEETLTWFLDGQQTHRVSGADVGNEEVWETIAHQGHFLLLNVAVGGSWPGYPDENTIDGEEIAMEVDYVRVYNAEA
ncbi:glycoside hydrolase family 16 protein [Aspergillus undulatus]|uniref:glycoside hydrolase family 16 protein n=1 Tax=Aspergillus undulatus TaxID=1810928 RepID=UPI003CCDCA3D